MEFLWCIKKTVKCVCIYIYISYNGSHRLHSYEMEDKTLPLTSRHPQNTSLQSLTTLCVIYNGLPLAGSLLYKENGGTLPDPIPSPSSQYHFCHHCLTWFPQHKRRPYVRGRGSSPHPFIVTCILLLLCPSLNSNRAGRVICYQVEPNSTIAERWPKNRNFRIPLPQNIVKAVWLPSIV